MIMTHTRNIFPVALFAAGLAITLPAVVSAQEGLPPEKHTVSGVAYVSGGIGEEAAAFRHLNSRYTLLLEFAVQPSTQDQRMTGSSRGEFVSDVRVTITDPHGQEILSTVSKGPFLAVELPAGHFRVEAEYGGRMERRMVEVSPHHTTHAGFEWPATPEPRDGQYEAQDK
jgi:hypothetical protein